MTTIQAYQYDLNKDTHILELFVLIDNKWYSVASIKEVYDEDKEALNIYCEQVLKDLDYNLIKNKKRIKICSLLIL